MAVLAFLALSWLHPPKGKGNLTYVHKQDPELEVAIETARRNLPDFEKTVASLPTDVLATAIKARFPTDQGSYEYLWVDHLKLRGHDFEGVVKDRPLLTHAVTQGQDVTIKNADIVDWIVIHQGNLRDGAYTDEVLQKRQN
jgi:uncharacterized protein YegJ (DUF2314 family)